MGESIKAHPFLCQQLYHYKKSGIILFGVIPYIQQVHWTCM